MNNRAALLAVAFGIAFLAMPGLTQTEESIANSTPAPVAYVYVQTTPGVMVYAAAANGTLTPVKGSPFKVTGQMEDISGKILISVGTTILHTYLIESNGAVGKQISETNTASYSGSACGGTSGEGSVLDHTGKYLYVQLFTDNGACSAWQTYQVESDGHLQFLGDVESSSYNGGNGHAVSGMPVPTVSSSDKFLYGSIPYFSPDQYYTPSFAAFTKTGNGVLEINESFSHIDPAPYYLSGVGSLFYYPLQAQADPYGHLAVLMTPTNGVDDVLQPPQLASYTINSATGAIVSTNVGQYMPFLSDGNYSQNINIGMSPSGELLAVPESIGLEIFHFNGAAPVTAYSGLLLRGVDFEQVKWDSENHLFALSYGGAKLYVYTVMPTSIKEAPGSPYNLPKSPYGTRGMVVVK
jgi:hypothetical protein